MAEQTNGNARSLLYLRALELLKNRPRTKTLLDITRDTGLPRGWLVSIQVHRNISPSVDRIERLYTYLAGKQLKI